MFGRAALASSQMKPKLACNKTLTGAPALPTPSRQRATKHHRLQVVAGAAQTTATLPTSLKTIVQSFQMVPDPMARYKQLLFFASKLKPMADNLKTAENKVQGCVSQVWVVGELDGEGKIHWEADSDSQLTKGLAALLVQGLSGCAPEDIVKTTPDFIEMLGLKQSLTPSRNNGFLNMFKLMQRRSLELLTARMKADKADSNGAHADNASAASVTSAANNTTAATDSSSNGASQQQTVDDAPQSVQDSIRNKLTSQLQPQQLEIVDESASHAGHAGVREHLGSARGTGETHFSVRVVSAAFDGMSTVKRHRLVYSILQSELAGPVHALRLDTKTPAEVSAA